MSSGTRWYPSRYIKTLPCCKKHYNVNFSAFEMEIYEILHLATMKFVFQHNLKLLNHLEQWFLKEVHKLNTDIEGHPLDRRPLKNQDITPNGISGSNRCPFSLRLSTGLNPLTLFEKHRFTQEVTHLLQFSRGKMIFITLGKRLTNFHFPLQIQLKVLFVTHGYTVFLKADYRQLNTIPSIQLPGQIQNTCLLKESQARASLQKRLKLCLLCRNEAFLQNWLYCDSCPAGRTRDVCRWHILQPAIQRRLLKKNWALKNSTESEDRYKWTLRWRVGHKLKWDGKRLAQGQARKQYEERHGNLERVEAYGYITCNWSQHKLTQTNKRWRMYVQVKEWWCTGCVPVLISQETEA